MCTFCVYTYRSAALILNHLPVAKYIVASSGSDLLDYLI